MYSAYAVVHEPGTVQKAVTVRAAYASCIPSDPLEQGPKGKRDTSNTFFTPRVFFCFFVVPFFFFFFKSCNNSSNLRVLLVLPSCVLYNSTTKIEAIFSGKFQLCTKIKNCSLGFKTYPSFRTAAFPKDTAWTRSSYHSLFLY